MLALLEHLEKLEREGHLENLGLEVGLAGQELRDFLAIQDPGKSEIKSALDKFAGVLFLPLIKKNYMN